MILLEQDQIQELEVKEYYKNYKQIIIKIKELGVILSGLIKKRSDLKYLDCPKEVKGFSFETMKNAKYENLEQYFKDLEMVDKEINYYENILNNAVSEKRQLVNVVMGISECEDIKFIVFKEHIIKKKKLKRIAKEYNYSFGYLRQIKMSITDNDNNNIEEKEEEETP